MSMCALYVHACTLGDCQGPGVAILMGAHVHLQAGYPKPFVSATRHVLRKRPEYRRRKFNAQGVPIIAKWNGKEYTNEHVVPHNPGLLMLFGGFKGVTTSAHQAAECAQHTAPPLANCALHYHASRSQPRSLFRPRVPRRT